MANLPLSSQADSLDSLTVTREQFRLQQKALLEFLAQALGNVSGDYSTQGVSPTGVTLQGTPTLAAGAEPTDADDSLRLACTRWVKRNAVPAGAVAPLTPIRGQVWIDTGSDPPAIKVWDDTPGPGHWVELGLAPDATTTIKGLVQLADAAAVAAGTAGRVVDAAQLKAAAAPDATDAVKGLVQLADAAAISAGTAGRVVDAAQLKTATSTTADKCKAWVNFDGTGTVAIRASYNVSSITDNGTGDYTVNFTTAMPDANYAVCGNAGPIGNSASTFVSTLALSGQYPATTATFSTSSVRVSTSSMGQNAGADASVVTVAIFR